MKDLIFKQKGMIVQEIKDGWEFSRAGKEEWLPSEVPGTVHTDLLANKKIDDPYYRLNERSEQWIDKEDWIYRTVFQVPEEILNKQNITIVFYGLDTYADILLNGEKILSADNMFRIWEADCRKYLKSGRNILKVYFKSPIEAGLKKLSEHGFSLPAVNDQSETGGLGDKRVSVFTRKAGYHYGWDWGPRFVTSGIWRPVFIKAWNTARIENFLLINKNVSELQVDMTASFTINASDSQNLRLNISIDNRIFKKYFHVKTGLNKVDIDIVIKNPELWWCNGRLCENSA